MSTPEEEFTLVVTIMISMIPAVILILMNTKRLSKMMIKMFIMRMITIIIMSIIMVDIMMIQSMMKMKKTKKGWNMNQLNMKMRSLSIQNNKSNKQ